MKFNNKHTKLILLVVFMCLALTTYAQISGKTDTNDEAAPINGLIALALAVGGYLGVKKIRK